MNRKPSKRTIFLSL